jgi:hypothetical protein
MTATMDYLREAVGLVANERREQEKKWGGSAGDCSNPDTPHLRRLAILGEEYGEYAKSILDEDENGMLEEIVQVTAVGCAIIEGMLAKRRADGVVQEEINPEG